MKRIALLLIALLLCAVFATALAGDRFVLEKNALEAIPDGLTEVVIPAEVDGVPVLSISGYAMKDNTDITSITVPEGVMLLENGAIYYNPALTSLTLPDSLQVISTYNVYSMDALEAVTVPAAVQYIGDWSFYACDSLRSVTFLGQPPVISADAFWALYDCVAYVPDDCEEAYRKILPEEITVMPSGSNAVPYDRVIPEADFDFDAVTGTITGYHGTAMAGEIPASIGGVPVTAIGENAFAGLECSLRFVRLPEGVTEIGHGAFNHGKLLGIAFPSSLKVIGDEAFLWATELIPYWAEDNGVEIIGANAFTYSGLSREFHIPYGVREIGVEAFKNIRFSDLYFPETIENVGDGAFSGSPYLYYIGFEGDDMPAFGTDVFDCQEELLDVDIAWNATREQYETACALFADMGMVNCTVWRNNPSAAGLAVSADGTYSDGLLVSYSQGLPDVTVYTSFDDVDTVGIGEGCFENSNTIVSFYPHHCGWFTTIGDRAFLNSSLEYVELFDSITEIGEDAFCGTKLREVEIPSSVTEIGGGAFAWCADLTDVTFGGDPATLPDDVFSGSENVTLHVTDDVSPKACKALAERLDVNVDRPGGFPEEIKNPYTATNPDDFWVDTSFQRLDQYEGYELNLVLPTEWDGVTLTMLSGNTLERARGGELPVRSIVVPETYNDIVYNAFNDLPDLEVAVIYGPQEKAFNTMFSNCPKLRAVIFVNGVDWVTPYAFRDCPALETVYFGTNAKIDAEAFVNCGAMSVETVAAVLPDVDALLTAVKSDPLTPPEPEPEPEMPEIEPITDPNADTYLGNWNLQTIVMDGESYAPADFGMEMVLVLTDDGMAAMVVDGESDYTVWRMENGAAYMVADGESFSPLTLNDDGSLSIADESMEMVFIRGEAKPSAQIPEEASGYFGKWVSEDGSMALEINPDGTLLMSMDGESQQAPWNYENGQAYLVLGPGARAPLVLTGSGLELQADNMTVAFVREGEAPAEPAAPAAEPITDPNAATYLGTWCLKAMAMGTETFSAAEFGMEMTLVLTDDGLAAMVMDGEADSTVWRMENGAAYIIADGDTFSPLTLNDDGSLSISDEGMEMIFVREGEEPATPAGDSDNPFVGDWHCIWMTIGSTGMDPVASYGGNWDFIIRDDGTATLYAGGPTDAVLEEDEYGFTRFNGMAIVIREDGRLQYGSESSGGMIFSKTAGDKWNPGTDTFVNPGEVVAAQISQQGAEVTQQNLGTVTQAPAALTDRIGIKFVALNATASGFTMDASMLGGEYAITFAENGDALFVMAGFEVPGLKWTADDTAFHMTYLDGTDMVFVATPEGFDLDFYGSMIIHFVPAV